MYLDRCCNPAYLFSDRVCFHYDYRRPPRCRYQADVDLSELSGDLAQEISDIRHSVNLGWTLEAEEEEEYGSSSGPVGLSCVSAPCSPNQFESTVPPIEPQHVGNDDNGGGCLSPILTPRTVRNETVSVDMQPSSAWRRSTR